MKVAALTLWLAVAAVALATAYLGYAAAPLAEMMR